MYELKRIALGEFMDDFDINVVNEALGLPPKEESASEEKVGEARLGNGSVN